MSIKFEKELFQIANTEDINERFETACRFLSNWRYKSVLTKTPSGFFNLIDAFISYENKKMNLTGKPNKKHINDVKRRVYECYCHEIRTSFDLVLDQDDTKNSYKDLNTVDKTFDIYKFNKVDDICSYLIFTKDKETRNKIFKILGEVDCFNKKKSKSKYNHINHPIKYL